MSKEATSKQITVALDYEFTAIQCECGMKYVLLAVMEPSKEETEEFGSQIHLWPQERVDYCPYCGREA